jgi:predicted aspartyl protease
VFSMSGYIGNMGEFVLNGKEPFENWAERLDVFFAANSIMDEGKQKSVFLTVCGPELYQLIRSLTSPTKPMDKTLAELSGLVTNHLNPKPNIIVERYRFNISMRKADVSISSYIAQLRHLSRNCDYKDVNDMIRDRLVAGINNINIQRKLLGEINLTLERAVSIAVGMETANREAMSMSGGPSGNPEIHALEQERHREKCFRCGDTRHKANSCLFKDKECFFCKKKGHISKVCASKKRSKPLNQIETTTPDRENRDAYHHDDEVEDKVFHIYRTKIQRESPIVVDMEVNGKRIQMELDTGASLTVVGKDEFESKVGIVHLEKTRIVLKTYGGKLIKPLGIAHVQVKYQKQRRELPIVVTEEAGPLLLGRNWLKVMRLDWKNLFSKVFKIEEEQIEDKPLLLPALLVKYEDVFKNELGTMKGIKVHIELKNEAKPKFFRARPVPYALKKGIEDSLDKLVEQGIYTPVPYSEWAAPIVPVKKDDGEIRICGDYKLTVNPAAECDVYPVPKTEDLLATLNGGEKFTKLDLRQAYQQLELDEGSQKLCTVNTHKGLFQPSRLQYGIHTAAGIFQREMERRLTAVPCTIVRVDDILITGKNDEEHMKNLEMVLKVVQEHGLRLKKTKCVFFCTEVVYLGFKISNRGVETVEEKVRPVLEAPAPQNTTQLKSFLGMLQYYHRHLPNLASILEPLHKLLRKESSWDWGMDQERAFQAAKERLTSSELLVHYDPQKPMILAVDASPYGIGAVLSHICEGDERPVAFASRTLNAAERNYSQTEREGLAVVYGVKKFHQYIYGLKFKIYTDHKPLLGMFGEAKPIPTHSASQILRWALL